MFGQVDTQYHLREVQSVGREPAAPEGPPSPQRSELRLMKTTPFRPGSYGNGAPLLMSRAATTDGDPDHTPGMQVYTAMSSIDPAARPRTCTYPRVARLEAGNVERGRVPRTGNFVPERGTGTNGNVVPNCCGTLIRHHPNMGVEHRSNTAGT
jgi:hypothetical protein